MRVLFSAILCLSLAVCITADDCILGERQEGDYSVTNKIIYKPRFPWKPITATIRLKARRNATITYVQISTLRNKEIECIPTKGGIGTNSVTIEVSGKKGEGLFVRVTGYAIDPIATTTLPTTTTASTTTDGAGNTGAIITTTMEETTTTSTTDE